MSKIRESIAKVAGEAKKVASVITGGDGIYKELKREHGEVSALMEQVKRGDQDTRANLFPKIRAELLSHAHAEQAVFYPALRDHADTAALVSQCLEDHRKIEELVHRLDTSDMAGASWKQDFDKLVNEVKSHVEREENQLFPRAKNVLSDKQAESIEHRFQEQKAQEKDQLMHGSMGGSGHGPSTPAA